MNTETQNDSQNEAQQDPVTVVAVQPTTVRLDTGNFSVIVSGVVKEDKIAAYVKHGLVYDLQRTPITKAYLGLVGVPGKKEGTLVFPEGFKRESVNYSEDAAEKIKSKVLKHFADAMDGCKVVVMQYVADDKGDGRASARALLGKWRAQGVLEKKMDIFDFEGDEEDDAELVEWVHGLLKGKA